MAVDPLKIAIKGTTQEHLPIEDIVDGMVILKDGSCAMVVATSSVNFDLLSEREQGALVFAYGGILNSLNFPVEIVIRSERKDVSSYLKRLMEAEAKQVNPLLREKIQSYRKFIEETVKKNEVLAKNFYLVVPFSILELGIKSLGRKMGGLPFAKEYILEKAKASLEPKRDHLMRLFARLGLEVRALSTKELIELFYKVYNEETAANQKVESEGYSAPIVTTKK